MVDRYVLCWGGTEFDREFYESVKKNAIYTVNLRPDYPIGDRIIAMPTGNEGTEWFEAPEPGWFGMAAHVGGLHLAQLPHRRADGGAGRRRGVRRGVPRVDRGRDRNARREAVGGQLLSELLGARDGPEVGPGLRLSARRRVGDRPSRPAGRVPQGPRGDDAGDHQAVQRGAIEDRRGELRERRRHARPRWAATAPTATSRPKC